MQTNISIAPRFENIIIDTPYIKTADSLCQRIKQIVFYCFAKLYSVITGTSIGLRKISYGLHYFLKSIQNNPGVRPYCILSIDGGGVRGAIPIEVLKMVEDELQVKVGEVFDEIVGTSAGGIIALATTLPSKDNPLSPKYRAAEIQNLFTNMAQKVFASSLYYKITSWWGAEYAKYPNPRTILHDIVGDQQIKECISKTTITSYDILTNKVVLFTNKPDEFSSLLEKDLDIIKMPNTSSVCDAAVATSAAPTYFPSIVVQEHNLVDGGVALNNPAQLAALSALRSVKDRPILIFSIGTGMSSQPAVQVKTPVDWGWIKWGGPINEYFLDASEVIANEQLKMIAEAFNDKVSYIRFQVALESKEEEELDNATPENFVHLQTLAHRSFQDFLDNQDGRAKLIDPLKKRL